MEKIVYVTGNYGKYCGVKRHFEEEKLDIDFFKCDLEEPDINDIEVISHAKAEEAFSILGKPCFVADSGFYIDEYPGNPGYPGAFVKRSGVSSDIDSLLNTLKDVTNRTCRFVDCLTFYDGEDFHTFYGICEGVLTREKRGNNMGQAKSNLWYVFIPNNCTKTLAEMTEYERTHRNDGSTSATKEFISWYKKNCLESKTLIKK